MNARESLAADRDAEQAYQAMIRDERAEPESVIAVALVCIAAELRAARVYANYLEGREGTRWNAKRHPERVS